jgi:hypothetical protein
MGVIRTTSSAAVVGNTVRASRPSDAVLIETMTEFCVLDGLKKREVVPYLSGVAAPHVLCLEFAAPVSLRNVSTAITRRWTGNSSGRSSLWSNALMCFDLYVPSFKS